MHKVIFFAIIFVNLIIVSSFAQIVNRLSVDRYTHYRIDEWISYAPALYITSVEIDPDYIYFGTRHGGILRYDKYANTWDYPHTTSSGLRSNFIKRIAYDPDTDFLYAKTRSGIDVYKPADRFWQPASLKKMPRQRRPKKDDTINLQNSSEYHFPPLFRPPNNALPDFFTPVSMIYQKPDIIYDQFNRIFYFTDRITDSWQRVWIGTDGFGPVEGDLFTFRLESHVQSISNIFPRDLYIKDDMMWIAGMNSDEQISGISLWDRIKNEWTYFEAPLIMQLQQDNVRSISGNDNFTVFATILGVAVYDHKKYKWRTITALNGLESDEVYDVVADQEYVYVGSENGFNWIDLKSMKVYEMSGRTLDNVSVNQLAIDDSIIWAATRFGLYSIDPYNDRIRFHGSRANVVDYDIKAVEVIGDEIWFAGPNGITYWNKKTDEWNSFPALEFKAEYRDIASTKNCVWFATNKGVLKYDRKREYWRLFTAKDGLINKDTYHIDPEDNHLWITTNHGITRFLWQRTGRID